MALIFILQEAEKELDNESTKIEALEEKRKDESAMLPNQAIPSQLHASPNTASQYQGDVVRLFHGADPILYCGDSMGTDPFQRQVTVR